MVPERLEPFRQALLDLRRRLRDGALEPGARVTAKEVAEGLKLSHTPVREALSRLAGEGLLEERRGDGFFVPELSAADIAVLYRMSEQHLLLAQSAPYAHRDLRLPDGLQDEHPVRAIERLFLNWVAESGSRVITEAHRAVSIRLAPVRRREGQLMDDLAVEAKALLTLADPACRRQREAAIKVFHDRRVALAEALAALLEPPADDPA